MTTLAPHPALVHSKTMARRSDQPTTTHRSMAMLSDSLEHVPQPAVAAGHDLPGGNDLALVAEFAPEVIFPNPRDEGDGGGWGPRFVAPHQSEAALAAPRAVVADAVARAVRMGLTPGFPAGGGVGPAVELGEIHLARTHAES